MKEVLKMRKHSVRKWLHALLDLLPLVVIPVFMVYSHRHQIDSYSVERTEYNTIHMQQEVINGLPTSLNTWVDEDEAIIYTNNSFLFETQTTIYTDYDFITNENNKVLLKFTINTQDIGYNKYYISYGDDHYFYNNTYIQTFSVIEDFSGYFESSLTVGIDEFASDTYISNIQFFNLTQMFGSGNEPTIDEFNALFPNDYYAVDSNAVAYVPYTRTYNDTDIGSQIFYSLYNSVDKYFNCNKLFSFNGVYNWINFNLFGGNAPLMVDVVYQIIVYEFFMDLIFLIYSVFMFIIDFASNFLEYCFSWSNRGGR